MLQAILAFPGVSQVLSWSFTLSHGITPSAALVEIAPQFGMPAEVGTMVISFGDVALELAGCLLDSASVRRDGAGMIVSLSILDRRWAWRYGAVSGRYNLRQTDGTIDPATEQSPQELATLLLEALGESEFDVSSLPDESRPEIDWVYANPAGALAALAESLACRVVLGLGGGVSVVPIGSGADLPETGTERTQNFGIDPPNRPDSLLVVGGPTRFQSQFRLEAVGEETTGEIKPLANLSYTPAGGSGPEAWFGFANVVPDDARAKARRTVYRWYRIKCTAPATSEGAFQIGGYDGPVQNLWQILPVGDSQLDTFVDIDGIERPKPAEVAGIFWDRAFDVANLASPRQYQGTFTIDRRRGLVKFAQPVVKLGSGGTSLVEPELYLTVAHGVIAADTLQPVRATFERELPGEPPGTLSPRTGPQVLRRDDLVRTVATQYDSSHNPTGTTDNASAIDDEAQAQLDAAEGAWTTHVTDFVEYAGIVPISPDGAIVQVQWTGGPSGGLTRAGRNSEFSLAVPGWTERRAAEKARQREETQLTPTVAVMLRELKGGR